MSTNNFNLHKLGAIGNPATEEEIAKYPAKEVGIVRDWLKPKLKEGVECPCCGKQCRIYGRKLNSGMASFMIIMYKRSPHDWMYVRTWSKKIKCIDDIQVNAINGDFSYLLHWKLLEQKPQESGKWRLTSLGRQFVEGKVSVPRKLFLLNNKCIDQSDEQTDIHHALGNKFDYDELMAVHGET